MHVCWRKSRTVFFPSDTLIYAICCDGSKNYNIRACEHMILGQLRMGARHTIYAPLVLINLCKYHWLDITACLIQIGTNQKVNCGSVFGRVYFDFVIWWPSIILYYEDHHSIILWSSYQYMVTNLQGMKRLIAEVCVAMCTLTCHFVTWWSSNHNMMIIKT